MQRFFGNIGRTAPRLGDILSPEVNSFGFMRLLMASIVLFSHSYMFHYGTSAGEPLYAWTSRSLSEFGVQVFFVLSGIMVAQSLERSRGIADFAVARGLRIFPALIVCVLLTAFALGPLVTSLPLDRYFSNREFSTYIAKTIALVTGSVPLPGVFEANPMAELVNTSLWTLKYEAIGYVAIAIAGAAGLMRAEWRRWAVPVVALFVAGIFIISPEDHKAYGLTDNVRYFAVFFGTGVFAYLIRNRLPIHGALIVPLFALFVAGIDTRAAELTSALFLGYTAIWLATFRFGPLRNFCNRYDLSYGIYIFAGPVQQALIGSWPDMSPMTVSLLTASFVVPLAYLSWTLIEHPALRMRRTVNSWIEWRPARLLRTTGQSTG